MYKIYITARDILSLIKVSATTVEGNGELVEIILKEKDE